MGGTKTRNETIIELGWAQRGEKVIMMADKVTGLPISNMIRVRCIGEFSHP